MNESHYGEGTYQYECKKPDCWHCELTAKPELPEPVPPAKRANGWSKAEDELVLKTKHMPTDTITHLFNRTLRAIEQRRFVLSRSKKTMPYYKVVVLHRPYRIGTR